MLGFMVGAKESAFAQLHPLLRQKPFDRVAHDEHGPRLHATFCEGGLDPLKALRLQTGIGGSDVASESDMGWLEL